MNVIIIPVRSGSKGIPNKNLAMVHGVTILERAIKSALASSGNLVIVSTDGDLIANKASRYPVTIHRRSLENSQDHSTSESVIEEVISDFPSLFTERTIVSLIQATSPFLTSSSIDQCVEFAKNGFTGFTAKLTNSFIWEDGQTGWEPVGHPTKHRPRRQDRKRQVIETGGCYSFPFVDFMKTHYRFCSAPKPVLVNSLESIDIDEMDDLVFANSINNSHLSGGAAKTLRLPKLIVTDFDGCLTDDLVSVNEFGEESVRASRKDGLYIAKIRQLGIPVWILSSEVNPVVAKRAEKLGIPFIQAAKSKIEKIDEILIRENASREGLWYIGNDLNDLEVMEYAGVSLCPSDSNSQISTTADVVLASAGGSGIFCEIYRLVEAAACEA